MQSLTKKASLFLSQACLCKKAPWLTITLYNCLKFKVYKDVDKVLKHNKTIFYTKKSESLQQKYQTKTASYCFTTLNKPETKT